MLNTGTDNRAGDNQENCAEQQVSGCAEFSEPVGQLRHSAETDHRFQQISEHPAGYNAVKAEDQCGDNNAVKTRQFSQQSGGFSGGYDLQRRNHIGACMTTDNQFGHECRVGQAKRQQEIHQYKGTAAILGGIGGKSPDIPQPHCRSRSRQNKANTG